MNELPPIRSRRNPIIQQFRRARDGAEADYFLVEGVRFLEEALRRRTEIEVTLVSPSALEDERVALLMKELRARNVDVREAPDDVFDAVSATQTSQGVAALARRAHSTIQQILSVKNPFVVIAAEISDPGNLGTLLRTAAAAGATGFITTKGSVSPWNDKALRASAGAIFNIPLAANIEFNKIAECARESGVRLAATSGSGAEIYYKADLRPPIAIVLGNEGFGLRDEERRICNVTVRIPMSPAAESLNVASAGAILCFEAARQRGER